MQPRNLWPYKIRMYLINKKKLQTFSSLMTYGNASIDYKVTQDWKYCTKHLVTCIRWCHQTSKELPGRWKEDTPLSEILIRHIIFNVSFIMLVKIGSIEENFGNLLMWDYFRFWAILRKHIIQHCIYNTLKIRPVQENKSAHQKQLLLTLKSWIKTM